MEGFHFWCCTKTFDVWSHRPAPDWSSHRKRKWKNSAFDWPIPDNSSCDWVKTKGRDWSKYCSVFDWTKSDCESAKIPGRDLTAGWCRVVLQDGAGQIGNRRRLFRWPENKCKFKISGNLQPFWSPEIKLLNTFSRFYRI